MLGVIVGKRIEARSAEKAAPFVEDPLAALDELGNAEEGLTFHSALSDKRDGRKGKAAAPAVKDEARGAVARAEAAAPTVVEGEDPDRQDEEPAAEIKGKPEAPRNEKPDKPAAKVAENKPAAAEGRVAKDKDAKADLKNKSHFTLQLSAFATKGEALDFVKRLKDAGYKPYVTESQVPGKGLMYRVRLGDFVSRESAMSAKNDFERKQKLVAYVAKL